MRSSAVLVSAVVLGTAIFSQTRDTAAIFGAISDSQGAAIPGATVTLNSNCNRPGS
jgi:hypothetical protein